MRVIIVRFRDFSMLLITFLSAVIGIRFPEVAPYLSFAPFYGMMALLYISFMPLRLGNLMGTLRANKIGILWFMLVRLIVLPSALYLLFRLIAPDYALAALLLGGAATGVVAPFIAFILGADVGFTTVLTVVTSFTLPFTLPVMVYFWAGAEIDISLWNMIQTLVLMILVPAVTVGLTQRFLPRLAHSVQEYGYGLGLTVSFFSTLAIFARYADFFVGNPAAVWEAACAAVVIAILNGAAGWLAAWRCTSSVRLTFIISTMLLNFTLIVVLSNQFFGPREALTAALYTLPFYGTIIPLRAYMISMEKKKQVPNFS